MWDLIRDRGAAVAKYGERALHEFTYEIAMRALSEAEAAGYKQHDFLYSAMNAKRRWLDGELSTDGLRNYSGLVWDATHSMKNQCYEVVRFACKPCDESPNVTGWHPLAAAAWYSSAHYAGETHEFVISLQFGMFYHSKEGKRAEISQLFDEMIERYKAQEAAYWSEVME